MAQQGCIWKLQELTLHLNVNPLVDLQQTSHLGHAIPALTDLFRKRTCENSGDGKYRSQNLCQTTYFGVGDGWLPPLVFAAEERAETAESGACANGNDEVLFNLFIATIGVPDLLRESRYCNILRLVKDDDGNIGNKEKIQVRCCRRRRNLIALRDDNSESQLSVGP
ncbi:hypothetical protein H5410_024949 [Solanum commersonii]|uniref:Uncharacterized protein n=1 Tax=Solanum commersonii TaxID=4109 RepID=A0A9J5ZNI7_SOLCO|nr:hypothetical protein H5410_024949 [Solanum commersonii]